MAKLEWDKDGDRLYETGTKRGVLYKKKNDGTYGNGVAWNGLTAVTESNTGAEETVLWADDIKYASLRSVEEFGLTIEAYQAPDEFAECDGSAELTDGVLVTQQGRRGFGFSYTTTVGNDIAGNDYGEKIHLVYGCTASPSENAYQTINDSPEGITHSWEITTTPVNVDGYKPTAHLVIDSTQVNAGFFHQMKRILYGDANLSSGLITPNQINSILNSTFGMRLHVVNYETVLFPDIGTYVVNKGQRDVTINEDGGEITGTVAADGTSNGPILALLSSYYERDGEHTSTPPEFAFSYIAQDGTYYEDSIISSAGTSHKEGDLICYVSTLALPLYNMVNKGVPMHNIFLRITARIPTANIFYADSYNLAGLKYVDSFSD